MAKKPKKWISKAIPKSHEGKFAAKAKAAGETTREYAAEKAGAGGTLGKEARLAKTLGYDPAAIIAKMDSPEVTDVIQANHALAAKLNITGTPTFVIDTKLLRGYVPEDGMKQIVDQERAG